MELEDLCVSLELAKELKENGYPQDTYFHRVFQLGEWLTFHIEQGQEWSDGFEDRVYAAPTVSEIGEPLPKDLKWNSGNETSQEKQFIDGKELVERKTVGFWEGASYYKYDWHYEHGDTEIEVRAKMWLYLKKNNLLKEGE